MITKNNLRTMSNASPACQFYGNDTSPASFDAEQDYQSFKKPRTPPTFPNSGVHALNEARTRYFKTQLCRRFRQGICTLGSDCSFAHCIGELRRREIGDDLTFNEPKPCRMFYQGQKCSYGFTCRFLHTRPDSVNSSGSATGEGIRHGKRKYDQSEFKGGCDESFGAEVNLKRDLLKTKLCIKWKMNGHCPYGSVCRFAHGQAELGKLDGYSTSECRVVRTSAATTNVSSDVVSTGTLLGKVKESFALNCNFERNELHRISRIYADWI